jgi:multiple sugar transport system ATP-binding protein
MDEPLSNLDAKLRVQTRAEIARLHQRLGVTTVYVTHDQTEAMTMGERIAVMSEGILMQVGTPQQLYDHPNNRFVAGFIGSPAMNFVELNADGTKLADGDITLPLPDWYKDGVKGGKVVVGFRPEHLELGELAGDVATIRGTADVVEYLGNEELLHVTASGREIVAIVDSSHRVRPGDIVDLKLPLEKLHLFDATSGEAIEGRRDAAAVA